MQCNNCKRIKQIPYIEHELRMYRAYKREAKLKWALVISNLAWAVTAIILIAR